MSPLENIIINAIQDKKGANIVRLDLTGIDGAIADSFIICNADSTTQVAAIADGIDKATTEAGNKPWRIQGADNCLWIAVDFVDTMVHIFQTEMRDFYRLEDLWADAPATRFDYDL